MEEPVVKLVNESFIPLVVKTTGQLLYDDPKNDYLKWYVVEAYIKNEFIIMIEDFRDRL